MHLLHILDCDYRNNLGMRGRVSHCTRWENKFHLGFFSQSVFVDNSVTYTAAMKLHIAGNVGRIRTCARTALTAGRTWNYGRSLNWPIVLFVQFGPRVYSRNRGREPWARVERRVTGDSVGSISRKLRHVTDFPWTTRVSRFFLLFRRCRICEDARQEWNVSPDSFAVAGDFKVGSRVDDAM